MSDEAKENVPTRATRAATHAAPATVTRAKRGGGTTNVGSSLNDGANAVDASDDATEALAATRARGVLVDASNGGELGGDAPTEAIAPGHKMGANGAGAANGVAGISRDLKSMRARLDAARKESVKTDDVAVASAAPVVSAAPMVMSAGADGERGGWRPG